MVARWRKLIGPTISPHRSTVGRIRRSRHPALPAPHRSTVGRIRRSHHPALPAPHRNTVGRIRRSRHPALLPGIPARF
ncbi:hypothetical protein CKO_03724 [Citrobacter koseri ATCC BAA-895]|uniref:Uncharacterized protein n=1 Tax=Citrobacter koseri (strain ATCC BAA-895 / CDC 4225-83 / SGSC4696) TaxID=290338 RepID=A8AMT7_CITK8|nr:hypothetical protein CKO_03724 [Citrobacter koseri ATCC BAA-895]